MKIFLIGMPGSGKTSLGKKLADNLKLSFIDLDEVIEKKVQLTIPGIFEQHGEDYFRNAESKVLKKTGLAEDYFVMATGGGTPCFFDNMDFMNEAGMAIYLKISKKELTIRLGKNASIRPMLQEEGVLHDKVSELLQTRCRYYEKADVTCESDRLTTKDLKTALR